MQRMPGGFLTPEDDLFIVLGNENPNNETAQMLDKTAKHFMADYGNANPCRECGYG
jgi:hypothetical protein